MLILDFFSVALLFCDLLALPLELLGQRKCILDARNLVEVLRVGQAERAHAERVTRLAKVSLEVLAVWASESVSMELETKRSQVNSPALVDKV